VIELKRKGVLTIVACSVFIFSFVLALMYPVISASRRGKIHFLLSPDSIAVFSPPSGIEADYMYVWVAMVKDSTYGSFTLALVGYETYHADNNYYERHWHWYTDHLKTGETYAYLTKRIYPTADVWEYDVSIARIDVTMSEDQLNATVIVRGKTLFSVGFWADTNVPIASRIEPNPLPSELYLSVEAYRPTLPALVTGLEVGDFTGGRFDYIDTELYDSSLLP